MKQRGLAPILIVLILAFLVGGYFIFQNQSKPTPPPQPTTQPSPIASGALIDGSITWDVPSGSVPEIEEAQLKETIGRLKIQQNQDTYHSVTNISIEGNWAVLVMQIKNRVTESTVPTGGVEFLAHKVANGWQITKPDDSNFCELLKQAPNSIISKDYYIGCQ